MRHAYFVALLFLGCAATLLTGVALLVLDVTAWKLAILAGASLALLALAHPRVREVTFDIGKIIRVQTLISRAEEAADELRQLAVALGSEMVFQTIAEGRWPGSQTLAERYKRAEALLDQMRRWGATDDEVRAARQRIAFYGRIDHFGRILNELESAVSFERDPTWMALKDWSGRGEPPSASDLEAYLKGKQIMTPELRRRLDDYRHFEVTGTRRSAEVSKPAS